MTGWTFARFAFIFSVLSLIFGILYGVFTHQALVTMMLPHRSKAGQNATWVERYEGFTGCPFNLCKLSATHDAQLSFYGWQGLMVLFFCCFCGVGVLSVALTAKTRTYVFLKHAAKANAKAPNAELSVVWRGLFSWCGRLPGGAGASMTRGVSQLQPVERSAEHQIATYHNENALRCTATAEYGTNCRSVAPRSHTV